MDKLYPILDLFTQIAAIPRASKNEAQIRSWLQAWAADHGLESRVDQAGNLLILAPASPGFEGAPTVILQGHLDMVCEKTPDSDHDFTRDPIRPIVDGDWLKADRTTLGADNGIAIALALALVQDEQVKHPPLELLFTVEEEKGITGAGQLEPDFLQGRLLLNLDSEDEGVFIAGSAGGQGCRLVLPLEYEEPPTSYQAFTLHAGGAQGGHSGVDIHKHRANAIKLLARALYKAHQATGIGLVSIQGGTAHNAIPREAQAVVVCAPEQLPALQKAVAEMDHKVRGEFALTDGGVCIKLSPMPEVQAPPKAISGTDKALALLMVLPHGVAAMSSGVEGFVETSNNLAVVATGSQELTISLSQRSTVMSRLEELTSRIEAVAYLAGAQVTTSKAHPAWQPDMDSPLLKRCQAAYRQAFGKEAAVKMIHAGLECGIIGAKYEGMHMISLGPTIKDPHSPQERLHLPSVERVWLLLVEILRSTSTPPAG